MNTVYWFTLHTVSPNWTTDYLSVLEGFFSANSCLFMHSVVVTLCIREKNRARSGPWFTYRVDVSVRAKTATVYMG